MRLPAVQPRIAVCLAFFICGACFAAHPQNHISPAARARRRQPHWITPLATLTPLLEREYRFDVDQTELRPGASITNWGGGKGLELIPTSRSELILTQPAYLASSNGASGWGGTGALVKYELAASPQDQGNYVATASFGVSLPVQNFSAAGVIFSPHFAWGKGWRRFDVQQDLALNLPAGGAYRLASWAANTALQYQAPHKLWPELEFNAAGLPHLLFANQTQVLVTPGLVAGPWPITSHVGLTLGAGLQIPTIHGFNASRNWIFSVRFPF